MNDALELIAEAEATLRERIIPAAGSDLRYHTLLVANALSTARRALSLPPAPTPLADVAAIRTGAHDADSALYAALLADARRRAWVSDPTSLTPADRAMIERTLHD